MTTRETTKFSDRLMHLMSFYQVSPEELGRDSRVEAHNIVGWTLGEAPSDLEALDRVAEMLGVSSHYLLKGFEDTNNPK